MLTFTYTVTTEKIHFSASLPLDMRSVSRVNPLHIAYFSQRPLVSEHCFVYIQSSKRCHLLFLNFYALYREARTYTLNRSITFNFWKAEAMITNSWSRRRLPMIMATLPLVGVITTAFPLVDVITDVIHLQSAMITAMIKLSAFDRRSHKC